MGGFIMAGQLILALSILVLVHEFGHFITARIFGIRVNKFYIFFNPYFSIAKWKKVNGKWRCKFFQKNVSDLELAVDENGNPILDEKGKKTYRQVDISKLDDSDWRKHPENTEYGIGWLPLGGFCQIAGMIDETQSVDNLASEPQSWEYRSKPAWQRLIVVSGGVIVNLIVGVLLFAMVLGVYNKGYLPNKAVTDGIYAFEAGRELGFQSGDKILKVDGKIPERFQDAISSKIFFGAIVEVERDGKPKDIVVGENAYDILKNAKGAFIEPFNYPVNIDSVVKDMPADKAGMQKSDFVFAINDSIHVSSWGSFYENIRKFPNQDITLSLLRNNDTLHLNLALDSNSVAGITSNLPYQYQEYTFGECLKYGWKDAMMMLSLNIKGLGKVISGEEKAKDSVAGPIGIAQIFGGVWNWGKFWSLTGLLSLILAFMNILPIPGLDGGYVLFTLIEMIIGRKLPDKFMEYMLTFGWILLMLLMIFIIGNDILKLFS